MAARLVDAQAPGLARRVRALADVAVSSSDWHTRLLTGLSKLQLLVDAYRRIDHLTDIPGIRQISQAQRRRRPARRC